MTATEPILRVSHLKRYFIGKPSFLSREEPMVTRAVDDVSFDVYPGETLGLVGESGCGKSTLGRTIMRMMPPTEGEIRFHDQDLVAMSPAEGRALCRNMQMIFQDPFSSLNPKKTIEQILSEPFVIHKLYRGSARKERILKLMEMVELDPVFLKRYPHEFSGGQRQRIGIARALALEPEFIVCDEAVSALDVSIQAQIITLLESLQKELSLSYLFIAHNLSVVRHISDRVAVMYLGKIMELADRDELYSHAAHPYTQALLSAVPIPNPPLERERTPIMLNGDPPSPRNPPPGCVFHTRCPWAQPRCAEEAPIQTEITPGHFISCHYPRLP